MGTFLKSFDMQIGAGLTAAEGCRMVGARKSQSPPSKRVSDLEVFDAIQHHDAVNGGPAGGSG